MGVEIVRCKDAAAYLGRSDVMIVDLRSPEQFLMQHVPDAYNLQMDKIEAWMYRLPKDRLILFYCDHGNYSLMAAKKCSRRGLRTAALLGDISCFWQ